MRLRMFARSRLSRLTPEEAVVAVAVGDDCAWGRESRSHVYGSEGTGLPCCRRAPGAGEAGEEMEIEATDTGDARCLQGVTGFAVAGETTLLARLS